MSFMRWFKSERGLARGDTTFFCSLHEPEWDGKIWARKIEAGLLLPMIFTSSGSAGRSRELIWNLPKREPKDWRRTKIEDGNLCLP
jgi:hypothetical protein